MNIYVTLLLISLAITIIILGLLIARHTKANRQIPAQRYMGLSFRVNHRNVMYKGCRQEVIPGFYKQKKQ